MAPDREGVLQDATVAFDYVRKLLKNDESRILIWGHSLGTAVAMQLGEAFTELERHPMGIVLEAPFSSLVAASMEWPLGKPYKYFPGTAMNYNYNVVHPLVRFSPSKQMFLKPDKY